MEICFIIITASKITVKVVIWGRTPAYRYKRKGNEV